MKLVRLACVTLLCAICAFTLKASADGPTVIVRDPAQLRTALGSLKPDTTLRIGPGEYPGGQSVRAVARLTVEALDAKNPPHFKGGSGGWHFSQCDGLTVRDVRVSGQRAGGLNLDDGAQAARPTRGVTLERVEVSDIGPRGNHDGIKASGITGLTIRDCTVSGWGGQGIDLVGCHQVLITGCRFTGKPGFSATAGVQAKGGSADVTVEKCRFTHAGERALNLGGSTGLPFFRPTDAKHEAARLIARDNVIEGSLCAAAFVGVDGAEFTGNTVLFPERWVFRILQETTDARFVPSRNGVVRGNRIVFRAAQVREVVNVGGGTAPETFRFGGNQWFAEDRPAASKPRLPVAEMDGVYGRDPR